MAYIYPYGDSQQLNLDWFLAKFKELYDYVMQLDPGEVIVNTMLSRFTEQYDPTKSYIPGDYCIFNGYIFKANASTAGTFDSTAWDAALPVDDIQGLRILLGGLSTNVTALDQNLETVENTLNSLRPNQLKRRWLFIGDSYGTASGTGHGWINNLITLMGLTSADYYSSSIGGAGFTTSANSFLTQLQTLANGISDAGKLTFTDIVVLGGANDVGQTAATISTAIKTFVDYANNTFPNAQVYVGMIGGCADASKVVAQYSRAKEGYSDCGKAVYLHNLEFVLQNRALIGSDTVHPTVAGYTLLSEKIFEALHGGCNVIYRDIGVHPVYEDGFNAVYNGTFSVIVHNETTTIYSANRTGKITTDASKYFSVASSTQILIARLESDYFLASGQGAGYIPFSLPCLARVRSTVNNTTYQIKGYLTIAYSSLGKNGLFFMPNDIVLGTTSAFSSCDWIEVDGFSFTAPSIMC